MTSALATLFRLVDRATWNAYHKVWTVPALPSRTYLLSFAMLHCAGE